MERSKTPAAEQEIKSPNAEEQRWTDVQQRLDLLNFPDDPKERAGEIVRDFRSGFDIEMFARVIHQVVRPEDIESTPVDSAMSMRSAGGEQAQALAEPSERAAIDEYAAEMIQQLAEKRQDGDDQAFLRRVGNILALAIVGTHRYADGNGRTARTVAAFVRGEHSEDIRLASMERDASQQELNGFRINGFMPTIEAQQRGETIYDTIKAAAAMDIPLANTEDYVRHKSANFTSPWEE